MIQIISEDSFLYRLYSALNDIQDFNHKGLLASVLNIEYELTSKQPHLIFQTPENEKLNFRLHDLQLGEDATYWHLAAQRNKKAQFKGFINKLYPKIGTQRGIITIPDDNQRFGICLQNHHPYKIKTNDQLTENQSYLLFGIEKYLETLQIAHPTKSSIK